MWGKKCQKIVGNLCRQLIDKLVADEKAELALRLFLQCALVIDRLPFDEHELLAYECFSQVCFFISLSSQPRLHCLTFQALTLYEESITESRTQFAAIQLIMSSLQKMTCFTSESHEPLRNQCALFSSKLFKKPDQARAVVQCAHLHWDCVLADIGPVSQDQCLVDNQKYQSRMDKCCLQFKEGKRVADCLKRSVKTASQVLDAGARTQIYVELLDHYVHYFIQPECVSVRILSNLF